VQLALIWNSQIGSADAAIGIKNLEAEALAIVADYFAESVDISARLDALELSPSADQTKCSFLSSGTLCPERKTHIL
jgi:hypothetical protein